MIANSFLRARPRNGNHQSDLAKRQSIHPQPPRPAQGSEARTRIRGPGLNFNAYSDQRSLFRYDMHALSEISSSIGTSTLLAAWNAAIYVGQIEDDRLSDVNSDRRYIEATRDVLQQHGGLWFYDESFVISTRRRE